jgi:hypothetical protein
VVPERRAFSKVDLFIRHTFHRQCQAGWVTAGVILYLLRTRIQVESCTGNSYLVFGVESSIARQEGGCKVSGRLVILLSVIAFTFFGVLMTFTYYLVPSLQANEVVSGLVPFKAIVEPTFTYPRPNVGKEAAETVAWLNAAAYSVIGLLVGTAARVFRRTLR